MPLDRRRKIALAAGTTGLVAVGATAGYLLLRKEPKGQILCPSSPIFRGDQLAKGDFVVVQLGAIDRSFSEATWGRVLGRTWFGLGSDLNIEIDAPITDTGEAKPLATDRHGFELGQTIAIDSGCVWDRYRPLAGKAKLVCGSGLLALPAELGIPTTPDPRAKALDGGDRAAVVVSVRGQPTELVWVDVEEVSPGGQVVIGSIAYDTEHPELHGLLRGHKLEFIRDCVVEADIGGM